MQLVAGGQYLAMSLSEAPRGMSMKCHGLASGRIERMSSGQLEESTKGSRPGSLQYRESVGLMGPSARILSAIARARGLRWASAINVTISCPLHPHPQADGTVARIAKAINAARVSPDVRVMIIQADT